MIVTFYSYKGGVGRSQLVANAASALCNLYGHKVLVIDWDLEAPGQHYYFDLRGSNQLGLIDLLDDYVSNINNADGRLTADDFNDVDDYIYRFQKENEDGGCIDLIYSGNFEGNYQSYTKKFSSFDWKKFYTVYNGNVYIEFLKKLFSKKYDYVLLDSRTGISDYSGICNIQMPDLNILVSSPNSQSFNGIKVAAEKIQSSEYVLNKNRHPFILPVLSRIDLSVERDSIMYIKRFNSFFSSFLKEIASVTRVSEYERITEVTMLEYKRDISFGENIIIDKDWQPTIGIRNLAQQYVGIVEIIQKVAKYITKDSEEVHMRDFRKEKYYKDEAVCFILGPPASGKTTFATSLFERMQSTFLIRWERDGNENIDNWLKNLDYVRNNEFPSRTTVGINPAVTFSISAGDKSYRFKFIDSSGEDLSFFNPLDNDHRFLYKSRNETLVNIIDRININPRGTFIFCVLDASSNPSTNSNYLLSVLEVLDNYYERSKAGGNICIIFNKWDLVENKYRTFWEFIRKEYAPLVDYQRHKRIRLQFFPYSAARISFGEPQLNSENERMIFANPIIQWLQQRTVKI